MSTRVATLVFIIDLDLPLVVIVSWALDSLALAVSLSIGLPDSSTDSLYTTASSLVDISPASSVNFIIFIPISWYALAVCSAVPPRVSP